jgi:hypothetical protein
VQAIFEEAWISDDIPVKIAGLGIINLQMVVIPQMLREMVFSSEAVGSSPFFTMSTRILFDERPVILSVAA